MLADNDRPKPPATAESL